MPFRGWLLVALAMAACHRSGPPPDPFPQTMAGGWRRTHLRTLAASEAPDPAPPAAIQRILSAAYEGPGKLEVRLYQLNSPAVALDLAQRWRSSADTVFFYARNYLVTVNWQQADRKALHEFVLALERRLGSQPGPGAP
jgi:hypothetical protein